MAKALKPLVIVLLVFSIAALILESMLFPKREALKGRTLKLEQTVTQVAQKLAAPNETFIQALAPQQLDATSLRTYANMDVPLAQLRTLAETRYDELNNTYNDLKVTRDELAATKQELASTKQELETTRQELASTKEELAAKEAELATATEKIAQLEQEKAGMQAQIDDLNAQLVKADEEMQRLKDEVAQLDRMLKEIDQERSPGQPVMPEGLTGHILVVMPEWNFVILDIGSDQKVVAGGDMLVHRDDQLVGKIRISAVDKKVAIAEIVKDWQKAPIKEGDSVLN